MTFQAFAHNRTFICCWFHATCLVALCIELDLSVWLIIAFIELDCLKTSVFFCRFEVCLPQNDDEILIPCRLPQEKPEIKEGCIREGKGKITSRSIWWPLCLKNWEILLFFEILNLFEYHFRYLGLLFTPSYLTIRTYHIFSIKIKLWNKQRNNRYDIFKKLS